MIVFGFFVGRRLIRYSVAQEAAQYCVHQWRELRAAQVTRGLDCLRYHCMIGNSCIAELKKPYGE